MLIVMQRLTSSLVIAVNDKYVFCREFAEGGRRSYVSSVRHIATILTLRLLMSYIYIYIYIYGAPILDVSRSHTTTHHSR